MGHEGDAGVHQMTGEGLRVLLDGGLLKIEMLGLCLQLRYWQLLDDVLIAAGVLVHVLGVVGADGHYLLLHHALRALAVVHRVQLGLQLGLVQVVVARHVVDDCFKQLTQTLVQARDLVVLHELLGLVSTLEVHELDEPHLSSYANVLLSVVEAQDARVLVPLELHEEMLELLRTEVLRNVLHQKFERHIIFIL